MELEPSELFTSLRAEMCGRRVTWHRVFLFTLQVYLDFDSSTERELSLWFEPGWHIVSPEGVVTGSGELETSVALADEEDIARADAKIGVVSRAAGCLDGLTVSAIEFDSLTKALTVSFVEGYRVSTFTDEPAANAHWVLAEVGRGRAVHASAGGLHLGTRKPQPS
jgi:hypothetical protein